MLACGWLICEQCRGGGNVDSWISVGLGEHCWKGGLTGIHARVSLCMHVPMCVCAPGGVSLCACVPVCVHMSALGGDGDRRELTSLPVESGPTKKTVVV